MCQNIIFTGVAFFAQIFCVRSKQKQITLTYYTNTPPLDTGKQPENGFVHLVHAMDKT
jgi:hypothetical protein